MRHTPWKTEFARSSPSLLIASALLIAAAFAIDWRTTSGMLFTHIAMFVPWFLLMAFLAWQGRRADGRMLTRSVVVQQRTAIRRGRDTVLSWLGLALAVGGGIVAGWLTQSVWVLFVVSGGVAALLGICSRLAAWLRRGTEMAV
jgi:hypothetical protein